MSMRQRRSGTFLAGILLLATSVGCGDSGSPAIYDCPELVGSWASPEYEALAVHSDGSSEVLSGLSMTMEVTEQVGCNFSAETIWGNGEVGGREPVAGRIHLNGREVTLLDLPGAGATGRVVGTLHRRSVPAGAAPHRTGGDASIHSAGARTEGWLGK